MDVTSELKKRFTGKEEGEDTTEGDRLGEGETVEVARPEEAEGGRKRSSSKRKKKKKKKAKDSEQPAQLRGERLRSVDSY